MEKNSITKSGNITIISNRNYSYIHFINEELGLDENYNLNKLEEPLIQYETLSFEDNDLELVIDELKLKPPSLEYLDFNKELLTDVDKLLIKRGVYTQEDLDSTVHKKNINEITLYGIQQALIIRQHLKERPFNILAKELNLSHLYKELELNKSILTKNKMISFFNYYCEEKNKKQDLLEMINSCRTIDFRTDKRLETLYRVKRYSKVESLYHKGLTLEEMAENLNCSVRTVKYDIKKIKESYK